MRRTTAIAAVALVVTAACLNASRAADPFRAPGESCVEVEVDNRHFSDVRIRVGRQNRRIGIATGKAVTSFEICTWRSVRAEFEIDPIGSAFRPFTLYATETYLYPDHTIRIIVGVAAPRGSMIVGL